jgi:hypothetical protein
VKESLIEIELIPAQGNKAAPRKFEAKRLGPLEYRNDEMAVTSNGYSVSNFTGAAHGFARRALLLCIGYEACIDPLNRKCSGIPSCPSENTGLSKKS